MVPIRYTNNIYVFDDSDKILEENLSLLVGNDGSSDVTEYVRAASLDSIQVATEIKMQDGVKRVSIQVCS